ncbi:hypothetical protein 055SW001_73 [Bacillus phage 055SW001]|nr:hypothetical protein 022DV001_73 [Bacillus phage 022DV001]QFG05823.1 hypothetical protein 055SW001_73 [Bacillus phage 055SW001]
MKAILKKVGEEPKVIDIEEGNEPLQKLVGGWIEGVRVAADIYMWVNEEGIIKNLPLNTITHKGEIEVSRLYGDIVVTGFDQYTRDNKSLTSIQTVMVLAGFNPYAWAQPKSPEKPWKVWRYDA